MLFLATFIISGCATDKRSIVENNPSDFSQIKKETFRGRLALRIAAETLEPDAPPRHFSGGFEINGNPQSGELLLLTPLGTIAAQLTWQPQGAVLIGDGKQRAFPNLSAMLRQVTGADLPIDALFAWLGGTPLQVPGWTVDLNRHADGRILARRETPVPALELRIVLEP